MGRSFGLSVAVGFAAIIAGIVVDASGCTVFDGVVAAEGEESGAPDVFNNPVDGYVAPPDVAQPDQQNPPVDGGGSCSTADFTTGYLSLDDAARVCAWVADGSCPNLSLSVIGSIAVPVGDGTNFSTCMHWLAGPVPPTHIGTNVQRTSLKCIAGATTCAAALKCLNWNYDPGDPLCDGGAQQRCVDQFTALRCDLSSVFNCADPFYGQNATCGAEPIDAGGNLYCTHGPQSGNCPGFCAGNTSEGCVGNILEANDCDSTGLQCGTDDAGFVTCISPGLANCTTGSIRCAGTTVFVCSGDSFDSFETLFECGSQSEICLQGADPRCVPSNPQCTTEDPNVNVCKGSILNVCVDGQPRCVDCSAIGKQCLPADSTHPTGRCG
jgi:hypothetical protein